MIRRTFMRKFLLAVLSLAFTASLASSQDRFPVPVVLGPPTETPKKTEPALLETPAAPYVISSDVSPSGLRFTDLGRGPSSFLTGNRDFPNFIGFISNPIQSIDPRASTDLWPMFGAGWVSAKSPLLPSGNLQVYGAGLNVALSDRLSFGLNQGGYAVARFSNDHEGLLAKLGLPIRDRDRSGLREGWLNLGGYLQYTLIADVPNQFILSAGLRWEAPSGATQLFQGGANPAYLSPYLTAGKEFGCFHILATAGYEFPAGSGDATTNTFYLNLHLDRKIGWLYPLVEFNGSYHTSTVNVNLSTPHHGVIGLGTFSSSGNMLTVAAGFNAVLVPGRLELGAVYTRPTTAQDHFDFNGMLVKMVYRY